MKCPKCKGTGVVKNFESLEKESKSIMAKALRDQGYSFREVAKIMGYASVRSVQILIEDHEKKNPNPQEEIKKLKSIIDRVRKDEAFKGVITHGYPSYLIYD